jgi:hypothetical protein
MAAVIRLLGQATSAPTFLQAVLVIYIVEVLTGS